MWRLGKLVLIVAPKNGLSTVSILMALATDDGGMAQDGVYKCVWFSLSLAVSTVFWRVDPVGNGAWLEMLVTECQGLLSARSLLPDL